MDKVQAYHEDAADALQSWQLPDSVPLADHERSTWAAVHAHKRGGYSLSQHSLATRRASPRWRSLHQAPCAGPALLVLMQQLNGLLKDRACPAHLATDAAGAYARLALLSTQWQQAKHVQGRARQGLRFRGLPAPMTGCGGG